MLYKTEFFKPFSKSNAEFYSAYKKLRFSRYFKKKQALKNVDRQPSKMEVKMNDTPKTVLSYCACAEHSRYNPSSSSGRAQ